MKIEKIEVKNLFGIFHHKIPLNLSEHITIIHGPNGFGKTMLLTMLNALFGSDYHTLRRIPFGELLLDFSDKSNLRLTKDTGFDRRIELFDKRIELGEDASKLTFEFSKPGSKTRTYKDEGRQKRAPGFPLRIIEDIVPELNQIGPEEWIHTGTGKTLSLEEVFNGFRDRLPFATEKGRAEPDWLQEIKGSIDIHFIQAQRLLIFASPARDYRRQRPMVPAVMNDSKELASAIQAKLAEYASLSQSLDRTFPTRLVRGNSVSELTMEELRTNLRELEEKRSRLVITGLLDKEREIDLKEFQNIGESNRNVLSVYIQDVKEKLSVLDELTNRIDLFVKTINLRFLYKQMSVSKKEGFIFTTPAGKVLSPADLSSGEQHMVVLLYELLFRVSPNSLILIDEPELSLHVTWQQQFLKHLQEITGITGFDVLIATHSPQIIHDRWDLTVQLEGPVDEGLPHSP